MNYTNSISISQLRQNATKVIDHVVKKQESTVIMKRSKPKAVIVDLSYYQALEEAVMDLTDAAEAERAKEEPRQKFSSYLKKRWGKSTV